jgi:glyceraldehyde 3-phosphate dehydrogenase
MIPTSTGAARALGLVLPRLEGRLDGSAIRVPTPNVSVVDLSVMTRRPAKPDAVTEAMCAAAEGRLAGILGVEDAPLVSQDFVHDPHSSIYAPGGTRVTEGGMLRVMSWYDNEWGFACRMLDTARAMAALPDAEAG